MNECMFMIKFEHPWPAQSESYEATDWQPINPVSHVCNYFVGQMNGTFTTILFVVINCKWIRALIHCTLWSKSYKGE